MLANVAARELAPFLPFPADDGCCVWGGAPNGTGAILITESRYSTFSASAFNLGAPEFHTRGNA